MISFFNAVFSNFVLKDHLNSIATADRFEIVREVTEFYADYYAINDDLFTLNLHDAKYLILQEHSAGFFTETYARNFKRIIDGISSVLYSFRSKPIVRYQASSKICKNVATAIFQNLDTSSEIYSGPIDPDSVILILDRREDPVTPLLTQWTYQAMVHEFFGIQNNKVDFAELYKNSGKNTDKPENSIFVLSSEQDPFYKKYMFSNFGDLGAAVKGMVEVFEQRVKTNRKIDTLEEMQTFVENYADMLIESGAVTKHVALMTEVNNVIERRDLMKVSALEQSLACEQDHSNAIVAVRDILQDHSIMFDDKLRILMLYALRYESVSNNEISSFKNILRGVARNQEESQNIRVLIFLILFSI